VSLSAEDQADNKIVAITMIAAISRHDGTFRRLTPWV